VLVAMSARSRDRMRELAMRERIAMIEKGLVPSPESDPARFDLLITPTVAVPPFEVGKPGLNEINGAPSSPLGWMPFCFPFNLTGQPAASVPVGFTRAGLPVGLQIVGRRHADHTVLAASAAFEAAQPWADRRPPID